MLGVEQSLAASVSGGGGEARESIRWTAGEPRPLCASRTTCVVPQTSSRSVHGAESWSKSVTVPPAISNALTRHPPGACGMSCCSASMMP
eukprot:scaffold36298_cov122-Isochrysis_galbana.AAC.16